MKVSILGVEFNSPNMGCGALAYSACMLLNRCCEELGTELEINVFLIDGAFQPKLEGCNAKINCIKYSLKDVKFWKKAYKILKSCDLVLDFSLGDSFADIYGSHRFYKHSMLRVCAILSGTPYVLGPQTYGPFSKTLPKVLAKFIWKKSDTIFVRDHRSQEYVKQMCGIEPRLTTDVAFYLPVEKCTLEKNEKIQIGFNPSGLLWDGQEFINKANSIAVDYRTYVIELMKKLTADERYQVYLIPHVFSADVKSPENDYRACKEIQEMFPETIVAPLFKTPMEAKGYISQMDLFIGARMHATIAAVSSGVATIAFSYSRKFEGLFEGIEYPYVVSATQISTEDALKETLELIEQKEQIQNTIQRIQPVIESRKSTMYSEILGMCEKVKNA